MAKYVVEVLRTVVARLELDVGSEDEAVNIAKQQVGEGLLTFYDPGMEDEYEVVELPALSNGN